jgi:hypothetical protein
MSKNYIFKMILLVVIVLGIITPYINYFVAIEIFYLLIPFGMTLIASVIIFPFCLIKYKKNTFQNTSVKVIALLPIFIIMQLVSTYLVDKIQRFRSEQIITNLESGKKIYPEKLSTYYGINYYKIRNSNAFTLKYDRGFFVREIYSSENKKWKSYGWND